MAATRAKIRPPLTDDQSALAAEWYDYAMARCAKRAGRSSRNYAATFDLLRDAAVQSLISACRRFDGRQTGFAVYLDRFLDGDFSGVLGGTRKQHRTPIGFRPVDHAGLQGVVAEAKQPDPADGFEELVRGLNDKEKEVLSLVFRGGLSSQEVAERLGRSERGVSLIKVQAIKRLRYTLNARPLQRRRPEVDPAQVS